MYQKKPARVLEERRAIDESTKYNVEVIGGRTNYNPEIRGEA